MISVYFLWFDYWTVKERKTFRRIVSTELFCRSILAIYTNDWSNAWHVYCWYPYFFSEKFLNVSKPTATTSPYGSGLACLPSWVGMVNAAWPCSMRAEFFLQMKFIVFQGCPSKLLFYLGSLLHIISFLFSHFRSWDYLEHFGI